MAKLLASFTSVRMADVLKELASKWEAENSTLAEVLNGVPVQDQGRWIAALRIAEILNDKDVKAEKTFTKAEVTEGPKAGTFVVLVSGTKAGEGWRLQVSLPKVEEAPEIKGMTKLVIPTIEVTKASERVIPLALAKRAPKAPQAPKAEAVKAPACAFCGKASAVKVDAVDLCPKCAGQLK